MKPKSFWKKLNLNKKTVANLNDREMEILKGGMTVPTRCTLGGNTCPCYYSEIYCLTASQLQTFCDTLSLCI